MKPKQPNLAAEGLGIHEATKLLEISEKAIGYAVIQSHLPCGIIAREWPGHCKPNLEGALWETTSDEKTTSCTDRVSGRKIEVRIIDAREFWYLWREDASALFAKSGDGVAPVPFLVPYDGKNLHRTDPVAFPAEDCVFWPKYPDKDTISTDEVIFLRPDLERYRSEYLSSVGITPQSLDGMPDELSIAFRAAAYAKTLNKPKRGYKSAILDWLKRKYPNQKTLSNEARQRIATMANPNKHGGAPSSE